MPVVDVYNLDWDKVDTLELSDGVFDVEVREHLFWETVRAQLAAKRRGTASALTRGQISGTHKKVWRQKGTGNARQGAKRAPQWVGGGIAFPPKPRDHSLKVNKRVKRQALRAALTRRFREGRLRVMESLELPEIKTRRVASLLDRFEADKPLIVDGDNEALHRSARNLPHARYLHVDGLNVFEVLRHDGVLLTRNAVEAIERRLRN